MRQYVRERKAALGLLARETFVPQSYPWGSEAQVDWYEAVAELDGERVKLQVFSLRSMASGGAFHRAYRHATQQAFLEAHELAFRYFGGVFHRAAVRQPDGSGEAGAARVAAGGDGAVRGVPLALAVRGGVLHAGRRAREGWGRERGRAVPAEPLGADPTRGRPGGAESAAAGRLPGG